MALAAGLPREMEDLSLNAAGNEELNDDGVEVGDAKRYQNQSKLGLNRPENGHFEEMLMIFMMCFYDVFV